MNPADKALLQALRDETTSTLETVLGRGREVVMLDTPRHRNLGDSLLWAGSLVYLARLDHRVVYHTDQGRFRDSDVRRFPRDAIVVFMGGGSLGDLYPAEDGFRRHMIKTFPDREYVILPQSFHYESNHERESARRDYGRAASLTVMLRERQSLAAISDAMPELRAVFAPDVALGLDVNSPDEAKDVVVIARKDAEGLEDAPTWRDWRFTWTNRLAWQLAMSRGRTYKRLPRLFWDAASSDLARANSRLLKLNLSAARDQYRHARSAATNRLHAHILAILMGIPHAVTDNNYGKIAAVFHEYTGRFETAHWAESLGEAVALANELGT